MTANEAHYPGKMAPHGEQPGEGKTWADVDLARKVEEKTLPH